MVFDFFEDGKCNRYMGSIFWLAEDGNPVDGALDLDNRPSICIYIYIYLRCYHEMHIWTQLPYNPKGVLRR